MSPKYEVEIPTQGTLQFEETVQNLGGKIKRKIPLREEVADLWSLEAGLARNLVRKFEQEQDPEIKTKIDEGVKRLIADAYRSFRVRMKPEIDWNRVKQALIDFFANSLPDTIPEDVRPRLDGTKIALYRFGGLQPKHIAIFIEYYGLADGQPKSVQELSKTYKISEAGLRGSIRNNLRTIRYNKQISQLLEEKIEYYKPNS